MEYKIGDLVLAARKGDLDVIAHGCNCFNSMGRGIAPQIAKAFPEALQADLGTIKGDKSKLGTFTKGIHDDLIIYNLYTQFRYGGQRYGKVDADYDAIDSVFRLMREDIVRTQWLQSRKLRIGIPKIGAGLAAGDWNLISEIIKHRLVDLDLTVYKLEG